MADTKESTDESIGRPGPWKETRYRRPGDPIDQSVETPAGTAPNPDAPKSTPVTRKDYAFPGEEVPTNKSEPPGGDAG
jgi:hypothetical protein